MRDTDVLGFRTGKSNHRSLLGQPGDRTSVEGEDISANRVANVSIVTPVSIGESLDATG